MTGTPTPRDVAERAAALYRANGNNERAAAAASGMPRSTYQGHLRAAARYGLLLDTPAAMPGFEIATVSTAPDGKQHVTQKREHGDVFEMPATHHLGKITINRDATGRVIQDWIRAEPDQVARDAAMRAVVDGFKDELPRVAAVSAPVTSNDDLLSQYTVTDLHFGSFSWREETGTDYDLKIAEQLVLDWFAAAIRMSPDSAIGVLAQLGDLLHFDGFKAVTTEHGHVLDADSRFQKIVRVVIRTLRRIIAMLLEKHSHVHVIMADANHDPASGAWLREMFAAFYEDEPRISVERSAGTYYAIEHGKTALFYHHGHKKQVKQVDTVFAGKFREIYGRTKHAYGHLGHLHSDEMFSTNLMKVERHETLAGASSYEANAGWISGRSAKVITYSKRFGEVGRHTLTPEMVTGAAA